MIKSMLTIGRVASAVIKMGIIWAAVCVVGLVGVVGGLVVYAWSVPQWQVFGPALIRGTATRRHVALTFDDGPVSPFTEQILDILRARKVPATFFVCGKNVERFPAIVRRIQAEGHALGNHTYSHPFLYFRSRSDIGREIDRTQEAIEKVKGLRPSYFRPPFGGGWFGLHPVLRERGLRLVQWSDTGRDWKGGAETVADIVRETLQGLGPGSIILLHDGRRVYPPQAVDQSNTVKALPEIIDAARNAGFTFVPLSEFLS
jgi:peptidoglycan-N-acetylglucosamine deacetylase